MQFFYHQNAGDSQIFLNAQDFHYLFHVRRLKDSQILKVRNLCDNMLYLYRCKKKACFELESVQQDPKSTRNLLKQKGLNLILAVIDIKDIYDILPFLNTLNVQSLNLFYADFSQKNRKINTEKVQKILQYSCMQCGRTNIMQFYIFKNLTQVLEKYQAACFIDFLHNNLQEDSLQFFESLNHTQLQITATKGIIIGAEGGFSTEERKIMGSKLTQYRLKIPNILTAHLASIYLASLCANVM